MAENNFPTRIPINSRFNTEFETAIFEDGNHFISVYNYLDGVSIPWESYTRRHIKSIGKTLSDMHFCLKNLNSSNFDSIWDILHKEIEWMNFYFKNVEKWIEKKLEIKINWQKVNSLFKSIEKNKNSITEKCILHYDFVRGNILFSKELNKELDIFPVNGILDFEKVCVGPRIFDTARSLSFLIVDCKYKNESTVRKRFLISGYEKRGKYKLPDLTLLQPLIEYHWLVDFWKFLVHNPYEHLEMNEHYKRTRNLLIKSKLLKIVHKSIIEDN